jgi:hypothetical protein
MTLCSKAIETNAFSGPVLWTGKEKIMIETLYPQASSLTRLLEPPLGSYICRQTWR